MAISLNEITGVAGSTEEFLPELHTAQPTEPVSTPEAPLLTNLFPTEPTARPGATTVLDLFPGDRTEETLTQLVTSPGAPDKAARVYQAQLRTGLPAGLITRNLDEIEQQVKRADFNATLFREESPLLAEWLAENPTRAGVAQGDYDLLTGLEKLWQTMKAIPEGFGAGVKKNRMMILNAKAVNGDITQPENAERLRLKQELNETGSAFHEGLPSWFYAASDVMGLALPTFGEALEAGAYKGLPAGIAAGGAMGLIGGPGAPVTVPAGMATFGTLGFGVAAKATLVDQYYKLAVGEAYDDLENATDSVGVPIDPTVARYAAMLVGVPNAALEFVSFTKALKVVPGAEKLAGKFTTKVLKKILVRPTVVAALKDFGKKYSVAVGTETFTEGLQKLLNIVTREIATDDDMQLSEQDVRSIIDESTQAFKASVVLGGLASGPKIIETYSDMKKAAKNEAFMRDLGEIVAESKTQANSPAAMKSFVERLKKDSDVQNVFVPVEKWKALFQDEAPQVAKELFGDLNQYAEATATGGDLVIPIDLYTEKLAGTEFHEGLIPNMRLNPGELTYTEANEIAQAEKSVQDKIQAELDDTLAAEAPLDAIYDDIYQQSLNAGLDDVAANRNAVLTRERLRTRAARLGVDPLGLYQERPLTIERVMPGEAVPEAAMEQLPLAEQQDFGDVTFDEEHIRAATQETVIVKRSAQQMFEQAQERRSMATKLVECIRG